jgi:uncharacterized protein YwbE
MVLVGLSGCDTLLGDDEDSDPADTVRDPLAATSEVIDSNGARYEVGYDQISGDDQDPFVLKTNASGNEVWRIRHDQTPRDARAMMIALDEADRPYVVYTTDGGSNDSDRFQTNHVEDGAFSDAPFGSYGAGGGAKVAIVVRLDPDTGKIERGTFLIARLSSGNTNTINPKGLSVSESTVSLDVESAAWPPAPGATQGNWQRFDETVFNDDARPPLRYSFSPDLTEITNVQIRTE